MMKIPSRSVALGLILATFAWAQDDTGIAIDNGSNETAVAPGMDNTNDTSIPRETDNDDVTTCNCTGCANSDRVSLGLHKDLSSPSCPEGSVATVTKLRTAETRGGIGDGYNLLTTNPDNGLLDVSNYVYRQASEIEQGTTCYQADSAILPVVGDQSTIEVILNCEAVICDFQWDVQFGCAELGVLTSSTNGGVQVLSDVDDTITCANPSKTCDSIASCTLEGTISHYLAGIDRRLEHKEMYPGVAELMLGLALGPEDGNDGQYYPAKPMMLSARPREAQLILAIDQDSELNVYVESTGDRLNYTSYGVNTDSSMYGTVFDGTSYKEFGQTKARSYNTISFERPDTRFAFLGDNGQGDVCGAQSMVESANGDRMVAVLIQLVKDPEKAHTKCESPEGQDFTLDLPESDKVHYHRSYSEAAVWALGKKLISCCSASHVWRAVNEWIECRCDGICPEEGLNTGFSEVATREETLAYCDELREDQTGLLEMVDACDPEGDCPLHAKVAGSLAYILAPRSSYLLIGAALCLIFTHLVQLSW